MIFTQLWPKKQKAPGPTTFGGFIEAHNCLVWSSTASLLNWRTVQGCWIGCPYLTLNCLFQKSYINLIHKWQIQFLMIETIEHSWFWAYMTPGCVTFVMPLVNALVLKAHFRHKTPCSQELPPLFRLQILLRYQPLQ